MYKWTNNDLRQSFVKTLKLNITSIVEMIRASEIFVCSPTDYGKMSTFVGVECEDVNNRWIYQIIDNQWEALDEQVCLDKEGWVMVKNKQHNQDLRYLVIFKDKTLKTIRELRREHVSLLQDIHEHVTAYMQEQGYENFMMYSFYIRTGTHIRTCIYSSRLDNELHSKIHLIRNKKY